LPHSENGEEVGWRRFALARLQTRHTASVSSLLLTLGWALWHTPLFAYRPGYASMDAMGVAGWFFSLLTDASRGSLLVVALFHAAVDVVFTSDASSPQAHAICRGRARCSGCAAGTR
jgi:membrane protease YdiL (CAAX protease family)